VNHSNDDESAAFRLKQNTLQQIEFARLGIFRHVTIESVWGLLEHCTIVQLEEGTALLNKGEVNHTLYIVVDGRLSVHLDGADKDPVAFLEVGQTVGELSIIDETPASAYVCAFTPARLLAIDQSIFWRMVEASHEFSVNMLFLLAVRLRENNSRIVEGSHRRRELEHDATVDALTGLHNRRWLDQNLARLAGRHRFSRKPFCVVMLDVDHFKTFNDTWGHPAGDRVLATVGRVISGRMRPTDLAARYGGEEFCIMLPETPLSGGVIAANRLREKIAETVIIYGANDSLPRVTVSLGVACLEENEETNALLARADQALYRAKGKGRNRVEV
jgi:diguanylate cyclase (GGDEF)-like protein